MSVMLPYGDDERFTMIAVLPEDMDSFIAGLDEDSLHDVLTVFEQRDEVLLQLPVFEMEQQVTLNDTLKSLGITQAFTKEADLSRISDEDIYIGDVMHKAKIKVDEEGTEAAAVTSVQVTLESIPLNRFEFVADKPFLFFIMDTENGLVLFTGKVDDLG
jgi:serpin B